MDRDTGAGVTTTQNPLRSLQTPRRRRNTPVVPGPGTAGTPVTPTTTDAARPRACTGESISEDERALFSGHQRVSSCNSLAELVSSGAADTSKEAMNRDFHVNLGAVVREYGPHVQPPNWKTFLLRKPEWCAQVGCCTRYLRHKVSRKKKRFVRDGFDLDLTYVAPRIIAMGYPSSGVEYLYRNPRHEVLRFFRERHWGHYKVYNLCSETGRQYSSALFHASGWCPFPDHGVPALQLMYWACEDMAQFLGKHPDNVVAIHCKAGKGRSGLLVCMLLLRLGLCPDAKAAIAFYNKQRTDDGNGVRVPSQKRYAAYYQRLLARVAAGVPSPLNEPELYLRAVSLFCTGGKLRRMRLRIVSGRDQNEVVFLGQPHATTHFECGATVQGNFRVELSTPGCRGRKVISFWVNSAFMRGTEQVIAKEGIDTLRTDVKNSTYPRDFQVHLLFGTGVARITASDAVVASSFKRVNRLNQNPRKRGASTSSVGSTRSSDVVRASSESLRGRGTTTSSPAHAAGPIDPASPQPRHRATSSAGSKSRASSPDSVSAASCSSRAPTQ